MDDVEQDDDLEPIGGWWARSFGLGTITAIVKHCLNQEDNDDDVTNNDLEDDDE